MRPLIVPVARCPGSGGWAVDGPTRRPGRPRRSRWVRTPAGSRGHLRHWDSTPSSAASRGRPSTVCHVSRSRIVIIGADETARLSPRPARKCRSLLTLGLGLTSQPAPPPAYPGVAPFRPALVIIADLIAAHQFQGERDRRRPAADWQYSPGRFVHVDMPVGQECLQLGRRFEPLRLRVQRFGPFEGRSPREWPRSVLPYRRRRKLWWCGRPRFRRLVFNALEADLWSPAGHGGI